MKDATIYTIAEKAGCSASTVSRVINNYPYVKKATRTKVLKLLQEYNFVPNETARSLVNKASRMIGLLISDIRTTHHTDAIYYLENEFSKNGYSCLIYNTGSDPNSMADCIQQLSQRKVDGVVMIGSIYQNETVRNAVLSFIPDVPVIIINGYLDCPNVYGIISDEKDGIFKCVKLLADKGKTHPVMVIDNLTPSNKDKIQGYTEGVEKFCPNFKPLIIQNPVSMEINSETRNLIINNKDVDAIIYSEDFLATIGLQAIYALNLTVPNNIAVVGVNNSRYSKISIPPLTTLDNMLYDTSMTAVRNMLALLAGERVNHKFIICSEIVVRQTT